MPRRCTICADPSVRIAIQKLKRDGFSIRDIAAEIHKPRATIHYHLTHCELAVGIKTRGGGRPPAQGGRIASNLGRNATLDLSDPSALRDFIRDLAVRTDGVLRRAEETGHATAAIAASRELRANAELLLSLEGAHPKGGNGMDIDGAKASTVIAEYLAQLSVEEMRAWARCLRCEACNGPQ